jgi:hypothetical protein
MARRDVQGLYGPVAVAGHGTWIDDSRRYEGGWRGRSGAGFRAEPGRSRGGPGDTCPGLNVQELILLKQRRTGVLASFHRSVSSFMYTAEARHTLLPSYQNSSFYEENALVDESATFRAVFEEVSHGHRFMSLQSAIPSHTTTAKGILRIPFDLRTINL